MQKNVTQNRLGVPLEARAEHRGKWIAYFAQRGEVVASSESLERLHKQVLDTGENPDEVVLTYVPKETEEASLGGLELQ
jgi:hypothetical protein